MLRPRLVLSANDWAVLDRAAVCRPVADPGLLTGLLLLTGRLRIAALLCRRLAGPVDCPTAGRVAWPSRGHGRRLCGPRRRFRSGLVAFGPDAPSAVRAEFLPGRRLRRGFFAGGVFLGRYRAMTILITIAFFSHGAGDLRSFGRFVPPIFAGRLLVGVLLSGDLLSPVGGCRHSRPARPLRPASIQISRRVASKEPAGDRRPWAFGLADCADHRRPPPLAGRGRRCCWLMPSSLVPSAVFDRWAS